MDKPRFSVVWERKRGNVLQVRARSSGEPELPLAEALELFDRINEQCRSGAVERVYRRGILEYQGLPWCGEFWLDDTLRLGPPSRQYETALIGPRIILVDALVNCIGRGDAAWVFDKQLRELSAFLSVVMGTAVQIPGQDHVWTWAFPGGVVDCAVRQLGYYEQENPHEMPTRGVYHSVPFQQVNRPDFSVRGIDASTNERSLPSDVTELWSAYRALTDDQRRQFLQAAAKWQEALMHWTERSTLSFALMVVACEALKPAERRYRDHNVYHVVEALLGKASAEQLREHSFRPQDIRNAHLHGGQFCGSEFVQVAIMSSYQDPTFDEARRALAPITQEAIIEWLARRAAFTMPPIERRKSLRRWVRQRSLPLLPIVAATGVVLGWMLRMLTHGNHR